MMQKKPGGLAIMVALKKKGEGEMEGMKEHLSQGSVMSMVEKINGMKAGSERDAMISKAIAALEAMKGEEDEDED